MAATNWPIDKVNRHIERDEALVLALEESISSLNMAHEEFADVTDELDTEIKSGDANDPIFTNQTHKMELEFTDLRHKQEAMKLRLEQHLTELRYMAEHPTPQG